MSFSLFLLKWTALNCNFQALDAMICKNVFAGLVIISSCGILIIFLISMCVCSLNKICVLVVIYKNWYIFGIQECKLVNAILVEFHLFLNVILIISYFHRLLIMHSFNIQANFEAVEITRNLDCTSTCMNIVIKLSKSWNPCFGQW